MYNALLDRLPEDYKGWLIRTDYRIGVQIQLCLSDPELSEYEKTASALSLLYGKGVPDDLQTAIEGLTWFMSCGNPPAEGQDSGNEPELYSFDYDAARLASGFRKIFGLDITRERLHWFQFVPMLGELSETAFSNVIEIRQTPVSDIDRKKQAEFMRMKKRFALPSQYTQEEEATIAGVLERARGT